MWIGRMHDGGEQTMITYDVRVCYTLYISLFLTPYTLCQGLLLLCGNRMDSIHWELYSTSVLSLCDWVMKRNISHFIIPHVAYTFDKDDFIIHTYIKHTHTII